MCRKAFCLVTLLEKWNTPRWRSWCIGWTRWGSTGFISRCSLFGRRTGCCTSRLRRRATLGWVCHIGATIEWSPPCLIQPCSELMELSWKEGRRIPPGFSSSDWKHLQWRTSAGIQLLHVGRQILFKPSSQEVRDAVGQERSDDFRIYNPVCLVSKFEAFSSLKYSVFTVHDMLLCTDRSECTNLKVEVLGLWVLKSMFPFCD